MAFITGLMLIDAPASALNLGEAGSDNEAKVKSITVGRNKYPYVSAQSFRYWLRTTLDTYFNDEWKASPVHTASKGKQQAYTEGDPITYPDDDLFGYMRAEKKETLTRVAPFRTSTLVSVAPAPIVSDFGVMARAPKEEGDKEGVLLHGHQFYKAVLKGMFSIDLWAAGTFTNQYRSGYQNLSKDTDVSDLQEIDYSRFGQSYDAYRISDAERMRRVQVLLRALARLEGGAKQTLHYTPVAPSFVIAAVTAGGNNIFHHIIDMGQDGQPVINVEALQQAVNLFPDERHDRIYVGRTKGFMDTSQPFLDEMGLDTLHPREALNALAADLGEHPEWMR